ncbi:MAG: ATP-binding protein [Thermodesulfobacteriota bacterium]
MSSIRRRILLPLLPLVALALLVTAGGIYGSVRRDLLEALDRELLVLARSVGAAVEVEPWGEVELELELLEGLGFASEADGPFYVIRDAGGALVAASRDPAPGPHAGEEEGPWFEQEVLGGRTYRLCTLRVEKAPEDDEVERRGWLAANPGREVPEAGPQLFWVTAGHPMDGPEETLRMLRYRLYLGFGALLVVLAVFPAWFVSRALQALRRLSAEADGVGPLTIERRLGQQGLDREVEPLVDALNRALDRLAAAYERQKRFTADAAHELRTPLSALRAQCEVVLRRPREPAELRESLEAAHRTALRLGEIVESLLALSRLENGEEKMDRGPVDLAQAAREAVRLNDAAAEVKGVALTADLPESLPAAGHHGLLVECLSNLVENAVRYTPAGGSVRVGGAAAPSPRIVVEDTGVGIPAEDQARIFDRFYRVDKARSRAEGGTGLGLAIAREIARLHGGEVTVKSQAGKGSRFEVSLPAAPEAFRR